MYISLDDTDSLDWMCTTYLAVELIKGLEGCDLIGPPRLVRLNPAVPWKTRGNGAICLRFGEGKGKEKVIGRIGESEVSCFSRATGDGPKEEVIRVGMEIIKRWSRVREGANPGMVVSERMPPQRLYWGAVRTILSRDEVERALLETGASSWGMGNSRGVIGAAAAMAWRPRDRTYELLAYRKRERWGTERELDPRSVIEMDRRFPSTFNNYDFECKKVTIAPSSPCPVLFGIRGDRMDELEPAMRMLDCEGPESWMIFLTNQATDDHVLRNWKGLEPNSSYVVEAEVAHDPRRIKGGHLIVALRVNGGRELDATAYEPSKGFRKTVGALRRGDRIAVIGELRGYPRTLNIEKLRVIELSRPMEKMANPSCPVCGKRMKSVGKGGGYRCRECGRRAGEEECVKAPALRTITPGWYEPPVSARRHLSKPLKRA